MDRRGDVDAYSDQQERGSDPERDAAGLERAGMSRHCDLAQKQAEARDDEAEPHQRKPRANPGEKGSFRGQVVTGRRTAAFRHRLIRPLSRAALLAMHLPGVQRDRPVLAWRWINKPPY